MPEIFNDRVGTHIFRPPSAVWGYLAQVNEWSRGRLTWKTVFVAGEVHMPVYRAIPVCGYQSRSVVLWCLIVGS